MKTSGLFRTVIGTLLLTRPECATDLSRTSPTREVIVATRVLGARYGLQGLADLVVPHNRRFDTTVEAIHAATMLYLARMWPSHARLSALGAFVAVALSVTDELAP